MYYDEFKKLAIYGRWLYKQEDIDMDALVDVIRHLSRGDRNLAYSLCVLWVTKRGHPVYQWRIIDLYNAIQLIKDGCDNLRMVSKILKVKF